jgi:tellurite resistance protein
MGPAFWWAVAIGIAVWFVRRVFRDVKRAVAPRPAVKPRPAPTSQRMAAPSPLITAGSSRPSVPPPPPRAATLTIRLPDLPRAVTAGTVSQTPPAASAPVLVPMRTPAVPDTARAALVIPPVIPVRWVSEQETISIAGQSIRGGLFYSGALARSSAYRDEPSVIDPTLPVAPTSSYESWVDSYWPQYRTSSAADRRSVLTWLAEGRKDPRAPIGLVFIYFYALERRLLDDARTLPDARAEVPRLIAEIDRLRRIYTHAAFQRYAGALRDLAIAMYGDPSRIQMFSGCRPGGPSTALLVALGRQVAEGKALSPPLAYGWARSLDDAPRAGAVVNVSDELHALFEKRYLARYGQGLIVSKPKRKLVVEHKGAALNRMTMQLSFDVPDVRTISAPQRPLSELLNACVVELQPLIKARRREPLDALEVAAAMPSELGSAYVGNALQALKTFIDGALKEQSNTTILVDDLLHVASFDATAKVRRRDCVVIGTALQRLGFGMEPDVRWFGPTLSRGSRLALYRCDAGAPQTASANYRVAQLFMQMAVAVASADGRIDDTELQHARRHVDALSDLDAAERTRLHAHLAWLTTTKPSLTKLLTQLKTMSHDQRRVMADAAVGVAASDGRIDPDEIRTIERIYRALGLSQSEVAADVHRALTGEAKQRPSAVGSIDAVALARKMEETADVQKLLTSIFVDEQAELNARVVHAAIGSPHGSEGTTDAADIEGLDHQHSVLMRRLLDADGDTVARSTVEAWCQELGLMPEGALESVSEAAFALAGDALFDVDDDDVAIRPDIREHLKGLLEGVAA